MNCFVVQLHAQYNEPDEYEDHRLAQSFEMSQFIRHTSEACDMVIVAGDFNFRPDQLGYKVIRSNANLDDCWLSQVSSFVLCYQDSFTTCLVKQL